MTITSSSPEILQQELLIRQLIERWAVWRDAGDWERFATVWHPDGVMMATWFQGPASEFIRVTKEGWAKGVSILHFLGGFACDIAASRAIATPLSMYALTAWWLKMSSHENSVVEH